jgi:anaerobic ribonucleoside-triphosphate reductase
VQVIKRDGRKVEFDSGKIESAIRKASHKTGEDINEEFVLSILDFIKNQNKDFTVEQIQDIIVKKLMCSRYKKTAEEYIEADCKREWGEETFFSDIGQKVFELAKKEVELIRETKDYESELDLAKKACDTCGNRFRKIFEML